MSFRLRVQLDRVTGVLARWDRHMGKSNVDSPFLRWLMNVHSCRFVLLVISAGIALCANGPCSVQDSTDQTDNAKPPDILT